MGRPTAPTLVREGQASVVHTGRTSIAWQFNGVPAYSATDENTAPWFGEYMRSFFAVALGLFLALAAGCAGAAPSATRVPTPASPRSATAVASATVTATSTATRVPSPSPSATPTPGASPTPAGSPQTDWTLTLYNENGVRFQNPDHEACTAASAQTTLNMIALGGGATGWTPTIDYAVQEQIFEYERANMTMAVTSPGSDPHGTRNALNYYGWNSMWAGVYVDRAYSTFDEAAKTIVSTIARTHKPAIIFTWFGGHTQVVSGYKVHGADPAKSSAFTILGVYLTDPLLGTGSLFYDGVWHEVQPIEADTFVTLANWKSGPDAVQFRRYWQPDSTLVDPIDGNIGKKEWYNRWVVVLATK
jgi:hypothetical protein